MYVVRCNSWRCKTPSGWGGGGKHTYNLLVLSIYSNNTHFPNLSIVSVTTSPTHWYCLEMTSLSLYMRYHVSWSDYRLTLRGALSSVSLLRGMTLMTRWWGGGGSSLFPPPLPSHLLTVGKASPCFVLMRSSHFALMSVSTTPIPFSASVVGFL